MIGLRPGAGRPGISGWPWWRRRISSKRLHVQADRLRERVTGRPVTHFHALYLTCGLGIQLRLERRPGIEGLVRQRVGDALVAIDTGLSFVDSLLMTA